MRDIVVDRVRFADAIRVVEPHVLFPRYDSKAVEWSREMDVDGGRVATLLELCGRTCYKSEDRITPGSAAKFIRGIVKSGHESVIEHYSFTVKFICDRATSHQLVRHRLGAYSQESQRYCDYGKNGRLKVVLPETIDPADEEKSTAWAEAVLNSYLKYRKLRESGARAEDARSVLPNSVKTELVATYNLRQWRHIFRERACNRRAQGQIRMLTTMVLAECLDKLPFAFFDFETRDGAASFTGHADG